MSKLSKSFIQSTSEILEKQEFKELVGENFPALAAVVKATIGINDIRTLARIIMVLIPGLDIPSYVAIRDALDQPITKIMAAKNSAEIDADDQ